MTTATGTSLSATRYRLPATTHVGVVHLQVSNLGRSLDYYQTVLGLQIIETVDTAASLGAVGDSHPLVVLEERRGAEPHPRRGRLGLFHFAILLPSRADLARFVEHLGNTGIPAGASDHLVSEALYLQDPDGLGIEVYTDRPRSSWQRNGEELAMATIPLDFRSLRAETANRAWVGMPRGTCMGHIHLHVGDLSHAERFFSDGLGLDVMVRGYPGALFLSAGGYHHHLGTNTWAGPNAQPPRANDARLLEWALVLPSERDVVELVEHLRSSGSIVEPGDPGHVVTDPWGTRLRIVDEGQDG